MKTLNSLPEDLTPDHLGDMAEAVDELRLRFLFDSDTAGLSPMAEQYLLLALSALENAKCQLRLADYCQMQKR